MGFSQIRKENEIASSEKQTERYEFMSREITFSFVLSPWEKFSMPVNGDSYKKWIFVSGDVILRLTYPLAIQTPGIREIGTECSLYGI